MILLIGAVTGVTVLKELLEIHNKACRDVKKIRRGGACPTPR